MKWEGPLKGGVSQSLLNRFMQCPYSFYIYAGLGLQDKQEFNVNLAWGDCYHVGLEHLIPTRDIKLAVEKMLEHLATEHPGHPDTFPESLRRMLNLYQLKHLDGSWETEVIFDEQVETNSGNKVTLRGKLDGISTDHSRGPSLAEHKCKGFIDPIQTKRELCEDIQCNLYMRMHGIEWVYYDLILIPEAQKFAPRRNYTELADEYVKRLFQGPCGNYNKYPIHQYEGDWIHQAPHFISKEQQEDYWNFTISPNLDRLCEWYKHVSDPNFDWENPKHYNHLFYKMPVRHFNGRNTPKFECDYHAFLIGEIDLEDLEPVNSYYGELEV